MSDIFMEPYWQGIGQQRLAQADINQTLASGVQNNATAIQQTNVAVTKNAANIASLQSDSQALKQNNQALSETISTLSSRITQNSSDTSDALAKMNQTLSVFQTQTDGYGSQIAAAATVATQASAEVAAIKNYADPAQIQAYNAKVDAFESNIPVQVSAEFTKLWTPALAEVNTSLSVLGEGISGLNTAQIKLSTRLTDEVTQFNQQLAQARDAWQVSARAIQGELRVETKERCDSDKSLLALINTNDKKAQDAISKNADAISDNAKAIAENAQAIIDAKDEMSDELDAASKLLQEAIDTNTQRIDDAAKLQAETDARQDGAIETNRKNIADIKAQCDQLTTALTALTEKFSAYQTATDATLAKIQDDISNIDGGMASIRQNLMQTTSTAGTTEARSIENQQAVSSLNTRVGDLDTRVNTLEKGK